MATYTKAHKRKLGAALLALKSGSHNLDVEG
jgi:hypothetical protein